ncbi:Re/Si-specific NAD(P)(+) transhydrogenase subunit alpha [Candidatus Venteria ishoeyi]|uniref:Re/Si-specific NAD(P)(+) transhydrogenase subunit alpha n=1 Tax=Candidatus Venteria ishoeyi TaxID=1899563 RepID=UPI0025A59363|nr:Re/Si-specific NAD(P)(+) transhydrogenase subunit alpha [Candidatus Venteria ishoeyi]MDM8546400.1 Re/Si-specific NAD(P)(+) transhydrogenase subunit alpha [Candidatus Venteria ishoeyi]
MPVIVVPKGQVAGEHRVALVPDVARRLKALGAEIRIEKDMGGSAFFHDEDYGDDVSLAQDSAALYDKADIILSVQATLEDVEKMPDGCILIGFMAAHKQPELVKKLQQKKITALAMELVPRISRAQAIDALSSQASIAGYKAVLMGADMAPVFFPMLTTAAGTIRPASVLVIGAGVAGLQAIATARRLGAVVEAYDVRAATKEQCESLGAKFIDMDVKAEGEGGYARELTEAEKQQQRDVLADHIAKAHVVITTAAIPGRASPKIILQNMVARMRPGSVIVDLAAEGGGNCELTQPGETIEHGGVKIHAPLDVASQMPLHASEMYSKNLFNLLTLMIAEGNLKLDWEDEVITGSALTHDGEIKHAATRELLEGAA